MRNCFFILSLFSGLNFISFAQQWTNSLNGQGDFTSVYNASCSDASGNIYLCGATVNINQNKDILVVKMNSNGDTLWTNEYNGPASGMDEALSIAVDLSSNVYVTGYQRGSGTGTDMVTIKYNSSGIIQWIQPYLSNILTDQTDKGNSIAVDVSGNVYVTGQSDSDPSIVNNDDYITIKYSSSGTQQWIAIKDGLGSGTDRPVKIVLDGSNNPIVTGRSFNGSEDDYLTIKYNGTNGSTIWEKILDRTHYDRPTDMVINSVNGNVYVTGRSKNITYDYVTVAYSSSGILLWTAIYDYIDDDRATSIALTNTGEVIVTGQSDFDLTTNFNYNITTIKYSTSGTQIWAKTFVGTNGNDDIPTDLIVDGSDNIFVSGYTDMDAGIGIQNDAVLLGYSTTGNSMLTKTYSFSSISNDLFAAICLNTNNDLIVCGGSEFVPTKHGIVNRYSQTGTEIWTKTHIAKGDNSSNSHTILRDAQGNIYVAGYSVEYGADRNHALIKIDANGNTLWLRTLNGTSTSGSPDEAYGLGIDASGFIYVGGYIKNTGTSYDIVLAKYNAMGDTIWTRVYDYPTANASDKALALALDNSGNIYLTGRSDNDPGVNSNDDIITLKYSSLGALLWVQRYNGIGNSSDQAKLIKVSSTGNIYVAGKTNNGNNNDILVIKYANNGAQQWVKTYDGSGTDEAISMDIDNAENVFITGFSQNSSSSDTNIVTLKLNTMGIQQWVKVLDGVAHGKDIGNSLACDNLGNVIIAGTSDRDAQSSSLNNDILIVKYDNNGNEIWQTSYNNTMNLDDVAEEIKINSNNEIYLTGFSDSTSSLGDNYDYITLKLLSDGTISKKFRFNGNGNSKDIPSTLFVNDLEIYVTGGSINMNGQKDLVTIKYLTDPNATLSEVKSENYKIYPNPSNGSFVVDIDESLWSSSMEYFLINTSGQVIKSEKINTTNFDVNTIGLPNGTYILKFQNNSNGQSQFILIQIN